MAVRALACLITAVSFVGSGAYVLVHPRNAAAPLKPPAAAVPSATPAASAAATARATPRITLQPGVRATDLPGITITHVS
jgi:hypothetical protein